MLSTNLDTVGIHYLILTLFIRLQSQLPTKVTLSLINFHFYFTFIKTMSVYVFSGPGYAVHQPGFGGNSLSDPNVVHQVTLPVANQGISYWMLLQLLC